jgi:hypothetical protein
MKSQSLYRWTAIVLIVEALLLFVPVVVLGAAINWPASLDEPASVMLPLIVEQAGAVQFGYFVYLLYSILIWPLALLLIRVVAEGDNYSPLLRIAAGFGIASAIARMLGIIRWLFPMPVLAQAYIDPAASPQTREVITVVYQALNDYAGSVGEFLGVSFFAAFWALLVSIAILRSGALPRWIGVFGLVAAAALSLAIVELFGIDLGPMIAVTVSTFQFWLLATGIALLFRRAERVQRAALSAEY